MGERVSGGNLNRPASNNGQTGEPANGLTVVCGWDDRPQSPRPRAVPSGQSDHRQNDRPRPSIVLGNGRTGVGATYLVANRPAWDDRPTVRTERLGTVPDRNGRGRSVQRILRSADRPIVGPTERQVTIGATVRTGDRTNGRDDRGDRADGCDDRGHDDRGDRAAGRPCERGDRANGRPCERATVRPGANGMVPHCSHCSYRSGSRVDRGDRADGRPGDRARTAWSPTAAIAATGPAVDPVG